MGASNRNRTTEEFITAAKKKHGDRFSYSQVQYFNSKTPITIICSKHGSFESTPKNHIINKNGGCSGCCNITTSDMIEKFVKVHGNKYDYRLVEYTTIKTPVIIICPTHGKFKQTPDKHSQGQKCPHCSGKVNITKETFIQRSNEIHDSKYDYSKIENISDDRITIICPIHGEFDQLKTSHLSGRGCYKCSGKMNIGQDVFISRSNEIHGNKYDYTNTIYKNNKTRIEIVCPKHGKFTQLAGKHLRGQGCPKCARQNHTSKAESIIDQYLSKNNIVFTREHTFPDCKNKKLLRFDFYLDYKSQNIVIEYNGKQHFESYDLWGGEARLELTKINDSIKRTYLQANNIPYIDIHFKDEKRIVEILDEYLKQF